MMKKKLRFLSLVLGVVMGAFTGVCYTSCNLAATSKAWDGTAATELSGEGTESNPYVIEDGTHLACLRDKVNAGDTSYADAVYSLKANINLNDKEWTPINGFSGTFHGNGYKISKLKISSAVENSGLFGTVSNASIDNLTVSADISCLDKSGILVGQSTGDTTLSKITTEGSIDSEESSKYVGGVVGYIAESGLTTIENSVNKASVSAVNYVGGIAGLNMKAEVILDDCTNEGEVFGSRYVGGIIGTISSVANSENAGKISDCYNSGSVQGTSYVGGIVGNAQMPLSNCSYSEKSVVKIVGEETLTATAMVGFADPYYGRLCGSTTYDGKKNFAQLTDCTNEKGYSVTTLTPGGCTRFIKYKEKVYLFTTTNRYAISEDGGRSFGAFTTISTASTANEKVPDGKTQITDVANTQPFVLPDGRIAVFYRALCIGGTSGFNYSSMRMRISDENGVFKASDAPVTIFESFTTLKKAKPGGVYEPCPVLLPDGTIAVYVASDIHASEEYTFANGYTVADIGDLIATGGSQNILMIPLTIQTGATSTSNGITIGETKMIFRGSDMNHSDSRPGMSVITQLSDGSYAMVIENSEEQKEMWDLNRFNGKAYNLVIQISYSKDGYTWTRPYTLIRPDVAPGSTNGDGTLYKATVPYISLLPDGRVVISCSTDDTYEGGYPSDSSHYKQLKGWVSKTKVTYDNPLQTEDLIKLDMYEYSRNEFCVWGSAMVVDGRVFFSGLHGINTETSSSTASSSTKWTLIVSIDAKDLPTA